MTASSIGYPARMLAPRGLSTELKLGVRRENGRFLAHAWVEWRGRAINDPGEPRGQYAPLQPAATPEGRVAL